MYKYLLILITGLLAACGDDRNGSASRAELDALIKQCGGYEANNAEYVACFDENWGQQ